MKIVADTNVLVSAFIFPGGSPEAVFRLALEGRILIVTSTTLLAELGRVLTDKFEWEPAQVEEAIAQVVRVGEIVDPPGVLDVKDDPDDNRVLEAAAEAEAAIIVSGDQHLLTLETWRGIPIKSPASFLRDLA